MAEAAKTDSTELPVTPIVLVDILARVKAAHGALEIWADGVFHGAHDYDIDTQAGAFYLVMSAANADLAEARAMLERMRNFGWGDAEHAALVARWRREGKLPPDCESPRAGA